MFRKAVTILMALILVVVVTACADGQTSTAPAVKPTATVNPHAGHGNHTPTTPTRKPGEVSPLLGTLGSHTHPIATQSALAQKYFDEGLILTYGFNHAEAIRSYKDALTLDPNCAMCYWGIAYALGPNINAPMDPAVVPDAFAALQKAAALAANASAKEQAYIRALGARYAAEPVEDRSSLDKAYADAMRDLAQQFPDDLDAATLYAEALMDLTPWNYWTKDGQATEYTNEITAVLEGVIARNPEHPGANHFYIHAVEASQTPERGIPSARRIEKIAPGAGHLVHMAAHIYWRTGLYEDARRINVEAVKVDEKNRVGGRADGNTHNFYYLAYYPHNIHFIFAAAQMQGQSEVALEAARKLAEQVPDDAVRAVPALVDFEPMPLYALARFGRWQEILQEPAPHADFQFTVGMWHWARGLAYARLGEFDKAQAELNKLQAIAATEEMASITLASFPQASTILTLAGHILAGELAGEQGKIETQLAELQQAIDIQDSLAYIEPPAWFYPVRQNLGAALLDAGRAAEAEAVYREDLRQYPKNGWSLFGLAQSLDAQGKTDEATKARAEFEAAWQYADVKLKASRF